MSRFFRIETLLNVEKQKVIARHCELVKGFDGDMAELGVYRGGTSLLMMDFRPEKTHHLFDTFHGIPVEGEFDVHKCGDFFDTDLDYLKKAFEDRPAIFHQGCFPETTRGFEDTEFCLVHLDADQYQSTIDGLHYFYPRLVYNGFIILDDWKWHNCPGVLRAVKEYFAFSMEDIVMTEHTPYQLVIQKKCVTTYPD